MKLHILMKKVKTEMFYGRHSNNYQLCVHCYLVSAKNLKTAPQLLINMFQ
jgi:hypothetical protein